MSSPVRVVAGLSLDKAARRDIFYLKTDLGLDNPALRSLKYRAARAMTVRTPLVGAIAAQAGLAGETAPLTAGSYHIVHGVSDEQGRLNGVVRSTLDGIFDKDFGLAIDGAVRRWLAGVGTEMLCAETLALGFAVDGAPFDYAVLAAARGAELRTLGDEVLDERPDFLRSIGKALACVHRVDGAGAGLIDPACLDAGKEPLGVFGAWGDYIGLHFDAHVAACVGAGLIDAAMGRQIAELRDRMMPEIADRPAVLLHGDPGPHNLCVDARTTEVMTLLDWEDAMVGDPLFDVAMFQSFMPQRRDAAFLEGYGLAKAGRDELRLMAFYFLRIALSKTVHRIRFDVKDRPGRTPGHHRILRGVDDLARLM